MKKHILLVDDDASLRTALRACLESAGFICTEAKDGHDASSWMEGGHPVDLIVTDHQMPRVTGLDFIKGLKSQNNTEAIPIIFYSGQLTADLKTHALQAGAIAVLEKPFPLQEFLDLVAQACEETR
ncbi:MAG: response regulator [Nitrospirales bacterium]